MSARSRKSCLVPILSPGNSVGVQVSRRCPGLSCCRFPTRYDYLYNAGLNGASAVAPLAPVPLRVAFPAGVVPAPQDWVRHFLWREVDQWWEIREIEYWTATENQTLFPRAPRWYRCIRVKRSPFFQAALRLFSLPFACGRSANGADHFRAHLAAFGESQWSTAKPIPRRPFGSYRYEKGCESPPDAISPTITAHPRSCVFIANRSDNAHFGGRAWYAFERGRSGR